MAAQSAGPPCRLSIPDPTGEHLRARVFANRAKQRPDVESRRLARLQYVRKAATQRTLYRSGKICGHRR